MGKIYDVVELGIDQVAKIINYKLDDFPPRYLGLPLDHTNAQSPKVGMGTVE